MAHLRDLSWSSAKSAVRVYFEPVTWAVNTLRQVPRLITRLLTFDRRASETSTTYDDWNLEVRHTLAADPALAARIEGLMAGTIYSSSTLIKRSVDVVFSFAANPEFEQFWRSGIREARSTSEGPIDIGSTYSSSSDFLGFQVDSSSEVIAYKPNRQIWLETKVGPFRATTIQLYQPVGEGTRVTFVIWTHVESLLHRLVTPIIERAIRQQLKDDVDTVKYLLEAQS